MGRQDKLPDYQCVKCGGVLLEYQDEYLDALDKGKTTYTTECTCADKTCEE